MIKLEKIIKNSKRVGRGPSSGKGKTSGRGMNGQRSRTGASTAFRTGGQTSYFMRLPKAKGFKVEEKKYISVNAKRLNDLFKDGENVTAAEIIKRLKIDEENKVVKIYNDKELKVKLVFDESIRRTRQNSK